MAIVGLLYVGGPFLIYLIHRQSADPQVVRLDATQRELLPGAIREYFQCVEEELRGRGFEPVDDVAVPSQIRSVAANLRLFVHQANQDVGGCTAIYSKVGDTWSERLRYVFFSTYFQSGNSYGTLNSTVAGCFPKRPHHHTVKFRKVKGAAELYALHQQVIADERSKKVVPLLDQFAGDAAAYLRWTMLAEMQDAANSGCLQLSEKAGKYRPTVVGAITMTWKLLWPWKMLLVWAENKRAAQILAQGPEDRRSDSRR